MNAKSIFTSKTVWGAAVTLVAALFPHALSHIGITDPSLLADKLVMVSGFVLTVIGRIAAKQPLNLLGS